MTQKNKLYQALVAWTVIIHKINSLLVLVFSFSFVEIKKNITRFTLKEFRARGTIGTRSFQTKIQNLMEHVLFLLLLQF